MPFLPPNQQRQSTEGTVDVVNLALFLHCRVLKHKLLFVGTSLSMFSWRLRLETKEQQNLEMQQITVS